MIRKYLLLLSLCLGDQICAQETHFQIPDTLKNKSYDYLFDRIDKSEKHPIRESFYLKTFLNKAKSEKNDSKIVNGYKNYLHRVPENLKLIYADSMLYTAKKAKDNALIGSAYLSKGIVYYARKKHTEALDNYLAANNYIVKTNDQYLIYKTKYNIAQIKYFLGFYSEAISLLKECITYFKEHSDRGYLNSLHSLGLSYNRNGNYDFCTNINEKGIEEGERLKDKDMEHYFIHSEGVNQYFKGNYTSAIAKIKGTLPAIIENKDFASEAVGHFYIGKSYWDLKKPELAIPYFKKVDTIFSEKGYIRPDLLNNYHLLVRYFKSKNKPLLQVHYIEKLLKADSIMDHRYKYLSERIHKEYDTKQLEQEKKKIEMAFDQKKRHEVITTTSITLLIFLVIFLVYKHFRNKRDNLLKYEELMSKNKVLPTIEVENAKQNVKANSGIEVIKDGTLHAMLKKLKKFEKDKMFLQKDLTNGKLATLFGTNPKYLSNVIKHYRNKNHTNYINDLRIDHFLALTKEEEKIYRYRTIDLADRAGFTTSERFTKAFHTKTGIKLNFFIQQLKKEEENPPNQP